MKIAWSDFDRPRRRRDSFKGDFGKLGVIGGSPEKPGAGILAAEAGARSGAGYTTLFLARSGRSLKIRPQESSFLFRADWSMKDMKNLTALVVGCGERPPKIFRYCEANIPMVIDASALSQVTPAEMRDWRRMKSPAILTPHYGEAAALLKISTARVKADPVSALQAIVEKTGQSVYLKGVPGFLMFALKGRQPNGGLRAQPKYYVNSLANPALATAGSGDVLAGILGGFLAQRPASFRSAVLSGLVFQAAISESLADIEGSIASDQLELFSEAFAFLRQKKWRAKS